jgi:hypothetical protein
VQNGRRRNRWGRLRPAATAEARLGRQSPATWAPAASTTDSGTRPSTDTLGTGPGSGQSSNWCRGGSGVTRVDKSHPRAKARLPRRRYQRGSPVVTHPRSRAGASAATTATELAIELHAATGRSLPAGRDITPARPKRGVENSDGAADAVGKRLRYGVDESGAGLGPASRSTTVSMKPPVPGSDRQGAVALRVLTRRLKRDGSSTESAAP